MKLITSIIISILTITPLLSYADSTKPSLDPKYIKDLSDLPTYPPQPQYLINGITVTSYLDGSYNYLSTSDLFTSGVPNRLFDYNDNGFTLQQAAITFTKQPKEGLGGVLTIVGGSDANRVTSYGMNSMINSENFGLDIWDANLQYVKSLFMGTIGKFEALAGYEYLSPLLNPNFSTSIIGYFLQPGLMMGIRTNYEINDKLNFIVGLNNGWDNIRDTSRRKTLELNLSFADSMYGFFATVYTGEERATPQVDVGPTGTRTLVDLVAQLNVTEKLTLVVNYDYLVQSNATLADDVLGYAFSQGIAGYINYKFNDKWRISSRGELFYDPNGYATGVKQNLQELTITLGYTFLKHLELRGEARHDFSNVDSFLDKNGLSTSNNQQSFALEVIWAI